MWGFWVHWDRHWDRHGGGWTGVMCECWSYNHDLFWTLHYDLSVIITLTQDENVKVYTV